MSKRVNYKTQLEIVIRQVKVAEMLVQGEKANTEIATICGVSPATITRDIKAIKKRWERDIDLTDRKKWRLEQNRKLDALEVNLWNYIENSTTDNVAKLSGAMLRVLKRRAELLGLDAPIKIQVTDSDLDKLIEERLNELAESNRNGQKKIASKD